MTRIAIEIGPKLAETLLMLAWMPAIWFGSKLAYRWACYIIGLRRSDL